MNRKASEIKSEAFLFKTHSALIKQIYSAIKYPFTSGTCHSKNINNQLKVVSAGIEPTSKV